MADNGKKKHKAHGWPGGDATNVHNRQHPRQAKIKELKNEHVHNLRAQPGDSSKTKPPATRPAWQTRWSCSRNGGTESANGARARTSSTGWGPRRSPTTPSRTPPARNAATCSKKKIVDASVMICPSCSVSEDYLESTRDGLSFNEDVEFVSNTYKRQNHMQAMGERPTVGGFFLCFFYFIKGWQGQDRTGQDRTLTLHESNRKP